MWVSLGALRFTPRLKAIMRERFRRSALPLGEHVQGRDGKLRYPRSLRVDAYRLMLRWLREYSPRLPVYLCMESARVWHDVFGHLPEEDRFARFVFLPAPLAD
jgi:spore photoproduct lyase